MPSNKIRLERLIGKEDGKRSSKPNCDQVHLVVPETIKAAHEREREAEGGAPGRYRTWGRQRRWKSCSPRQGRHRRRRGAAPSGASRQACWRRAPSRRRPSRARPRPRSRAPPPRLPRTRCTVSSSPFLRRRNPPPPPPPPLGRYFQQETKGMDRN